MGRSQAGNIGVQCAASPTKENRTLTKIILVRHGHVEGIHPPRFRGREDLPLTERGQEQASRVASRICEKWGPTCVYTSPLARCVTTASAIASASRISSRAIDQLADIDYGDWQMRTYDEIKAAEPQLLASWFATPHLMRFPNGESLQQLAARSADSLRFALERHPDQTVVLVAHDSVNRALLVQLADMPLSAYWRLAQDPCCINEIDFAGAQVQVRCINDTSHLDGLDQP